MEYGLMMEYYELSKFQWEKVMKAEKDKVSKPDMFNKLTAYLVVASFACEIGMKGLINEQKIIHYYELKENERDKPVKDHRLYNLYSLLSDDQKEYIYNRMTSKRNCSKDEFEQTFEIISNTFYDFRYTYEGKDCRSNWLFVMDLIESIVNYYQDNMIATIKL